ncbi:MAG: hypothetical protein LW809_07045, partial [Vampirovibrionales bacterium]|nr:hypothetical protein [Vampirovibrionales bacterium]
PKPSPSSNGNGDWGAKPPTTFSSRLLNEKPEITSFRKPSNAKDLFNESRFGKTDNTQFTTPPQIPNSSDTTPASRTEIELGVGGTLNLPPESQVTAFTEEGNRITITFAETKEGKSHETTVTLPQSELERVLASLSPEQQQAIKDLQDGKQSTGDETPNAPNTPNTPNETETISQLRERAFKEYEEDKQANGGKDPEWHPDELGRGPNGEERIVTRPLKFKKIDENTYQAPPELRKA